MPDNTPKPKLSNSDKRLATALAQARNISLQKQLNPAPKPIIQPESKDLKGQLDYQLPNGDLVFRLPTDRMPCVKPGNQLLYTMPVLPYKKEQIQPEKPGSIPNPAL